ncbi:unnamed protein product, partial [Ectocarpus sp. 12 AP-2014]
AHALDASLVSASIGCDDFTLSGSFATDRDNTGGGAEAYFFEITDGAGTVIESSTIGPPGIPIPTVIPFSGSPDTYDTPPGFNPITLRLVSEAGNGLPELVAFSQVGTCSTLSGVPVPATPWWALLLGLLALLVVAAR